LSKVRLSSATEKSNRRQTKNSAMSGHELVEVIMDSSGSYLVSLMDLPEDDQVCLTHE